MRREIDKYENWYCRGSTAPPPSTSDTASTYRRARSLGLVLERIFDFVWVIQERRSVTRWSRVKVFANVLRESRERVIVWSRDANTIVNDNKFILREISVS